MSSPEGAATFTVQMDFTRFFEDSSPGLLRLCFLTTLDPEAAADAAQEAMARAWRDWDRVSATGSDPGAWTRTVALNLCRDRWRRARVAHDHRPEGPGPRPDDLPDVDLRRALAGLATRQREAVVLRYWADLDLAGVAEAMGVSVGSVKQHLARAHRHLAAELGEAALDDLEVDAS
ncbi:MAG TPA: sigma-70 family RNA polymerase sigma factor [Iamia sp.]